VKKEGYVQLDVSTNVSRVIGYEDISGSRLPIMSQRAAESSVLVRSHSTVIMGGLYEETERETVRSAPFIGHIPLARKAFESKNRETVRSEVMIEITPTVLVPGEDFQPEYTNVCKPADMGDIVADKLLGPALRQKMEQTEDNVDALLDPDGIQVTQDALIDGP
jgi:type II secretory pathway component GspD/PulD (secretin)